jgi:hypothetical protein
MSALFFIFAAVKTNWVYKTFKYLRKVYFRNDKRVAAYLVCVAIATVFWFLNALSKSYTVKLVVPVKYVDLPNNKTLANNMPADFELTIEAHGFTILRQELAFLFIPLEFNVNELTNNRMTESNKSYFEFPSRQFLTELSYQISNDLKILSISPDTLVFRFDKMGQKRVNVKPNFRLDLKKQYQVSGDITTIPESVIVNGPQTMLDTLHLVSTKREIFDQVEENIHVEVPLNRVNELFFEPKSVILNIPVEEYTEAEQTVPVTVVGQPEGMTVKLFPSKVKLKFLVGLSRFSDIHPEDFRLNVSYSDILEGKLRLKVKTESKPPHLYDLKITPEDIEYLIEN